MFEKYCGLEKVIDGERYHIATRKVVIDSEVLGRVAGELEGLFDAGRLLLVCDENTWRVAGEAVAAGFVGTSWEVDKLGVIEPAGKHAVCDDENIAHVRECLASGSYTGVIAVGAGTVNDIAKMASFQVGLPYVVVTTAPSMNGYTSKIAAILSNGVKTTQPCQVPLAVFCDLEVMALAPYRMIASGLGDLLSKPVSNADWRLGARLAGAAYSTFPLEMIEAAGRALEGVAARLPSRELDAVRGLCEALCLSGMAMAAAGTSSPASGGEHLISHYLDMVAIAQGREHDFHGCQVGVGTMATAALYERFLALDPESIDIDACVARHLPWDIYQRTLAQRFDRYGLTDAVVEHCGKLYPDRHTLRQRLWQLIRDWDDILKDVSASLWTSSRIRQELEDADCPRAFEDIDVEPGLAREAVLQCKDIRARYTILHLASEIGMLTPWADEILVPGAGFLTR